jgi:hypothetical protein
MAKLTVTGALKTRELLLTAVCRETSARAADIFRRNREGVEAEELSQKDNLYTSTE